MKVPEIIHKFIIAKKMGKRKRVGSGRTRKGSQGRNQEGSQLPTAGSGALQIRAITE